MKRSEMVELLVNNLSEAGADFFDSKKNIAEDLLSAIEQAGMLPPKAIVDPEWAELASKANVWEPEDLEGE